MDIGLQIRIGSDTSQNPLSALIIVPYKKKPVTSNKKLFIDPLKFVNLEGE